MEFACFSTWGQLPESADGLFAHAEQESIFFSRAWLEEVVSESLQGEQALTLACVIEEDRVLALLPLMSKEAAHLDSLSHLYTSLSTLLVSESAQQPVYDCLVHGLGSLHTRSLKIDPVAENDEKLLRLERSLQSAGFSCHRHFRFYNWIHRTEGQSFADYMATRPARVRNTVARKQRKLEREHGFRIRLYSGDDWPQGLADYDIVYRASWKAHELFDDFIRRLADTLYQRGWLRLAVLYIADQPVAAQFWFVANGKASIFKLHYDQQWKQYSPGSILTRFMMEQVIDIDRVEEIDFLNGNDAYKQDWMSQRRVRWTLYCAKPRQNQTRTEKIAGSINGWAKRLARLGGIDRRQRKLSSTTPSHWRKTSS